MAARTLRGQLSAHEVDLCAMRDDAAVEAHVQDLADSLLPIWSVVKGALVDVHSDEAIGQGGVEIAGELHGVVEALFAVVESMLNAGAQCIGGGQHRLGAK